MKPGVILSLFPTLLFVFMVGGAQNAAAEDVRIVVGGGRSHTYRPYNYRTSDTVYGTWYPSTTTYGYSDNRYYGNSYSGNSYYGSSYSTPYVYSTPSVEFNTWYGDGYRSSRGGSYSGRNGYYGGGSSWRGGSRR